MSGRSGARISNSKNPIAELTHRIQVHRDSLAFSRKSSGATDANSESHGARSRKSSLNPASSNFHLIQLRILELKSLAIRASAAGEPLTHVRVLLGMAGFSHISGPIRIAGQRSVDVPDEVFDFETDSGTDDPLLSVKILDHALYTAPSKRASDQHAPELSSGVVDLDALIEAGGEHRLHFKMSCDSETGCIPELQVQVRSQCRKADFVLSYLPEGPVFKKAGYVISPQGIQAFPQFYSKRGLPPGFSFQTLKASGAAAVRRTRPPRSSTVRSAIFSHFSKKPGTQNWPKCWGLLAKSQGEGLPARAARGTLR